ncbi:MAG: phenylacetate-CoA oxygenase subunit PaaI [Pseudomonadales bacterium]|nr:phenylacetate-CoA oxygenase subunit PaaI [Pseudomonadales bacterium]
MSDQTPSALSELLCLADSKWTLGHWYMKVMLNCRTLTDATAFAGMSQDELGHTRALFRYLEESEGLPDHQLEFGRTADQIHNMQLLDTAPENRGDFMLTAYLAEAALWSFLATFKNGNNADVAGMVKHFGKESRFHRLNLLGWAKSLEDTERAQMIAALPNRLPLALAWFGSSESDVLFDNGMRTVSMTEARNAFVEGPVAELQNLLGQSELPGSNSSDHEWDVLRRRPTGSSMPATLWEAMLPSNEEAVLARRPLSISIEDNIDLFDKTG